MATVSFASRDAGITFGPGTCLGPAPRGADSQAHRRAHAVADALLRATECSVGGGLIEESSYVPVARTPLLHAAPGFPKGALSACFRRPEQNNNKTSSSCDDAAVAKLDVAGAASAAAVVAIGDVVESLKLAKSTGNAHFAAGAYTDAIAAYRAGLRAAGPAATHCAAERARGSDAGTEIAAAALHRLVVTLQVNTAVCFYRVSDFRGCDRYCTRAIGLCRAHPKALMFRARARLALGDADAALADCAAIDESLTAAAASPMVDVDSAVTAGDADAAAFRATLVKAAAQAGLECAEVKAAATVARKAQREQAGRGLRAAFGGGGR